jgi:8-oxo-dGTP diphosphatase
MLESDHIGPGRTVRHASYGIGWTGPLRDVTLPGMTAARSEHLVVGGVLCRGARVLLVHRNPQREWYPDTWDLPGGHVEPAERPDRALERELREELGVTATVTGPVLAQVVGSDFRMDVWAISAWRGEPANLVPAEHDDLRWFTAAELTALRLADPRIPQLVAAALESTDAAL